jgi:hypothetical protein
VRKIISELSEDFVKVAETKDIQPSQMRGVQVNGENVCIVNVEGKYYAIGMVRSSFLEYVPVPEVHISSNL